MMTSRCRLPPRESGPSVWATGAGHGLIHDARWAGRHFSSATPSAHYCGIVDETSPSSPRSTPAAWFRERRSGRTSTVTSRPATIASAPTYDRSIAHGSNGPHAAASVSFSQLVSRCAGGHGRYPMLMIYLNPDPPACVPRRGVSPVGVDSNRMVCGFMSFRTGISRRLIGHNSAETGDPDMESATSRRSWQTLVATLIPLRGRFGNRVFAARRSRRGTAPHPPPWQIGASAAKSSPVPAAAYRQLHYAAGMVMFPGEWAFDSGAPKRAGRSKRCFNCNCPISQRACSEAGASRFGHRYLAALQSCFVGRLPARLPRPARPP